MRKLILTTYLLAWTLVSGFAQIQPVTLEPDGGNKRATVSENIGVVKIDITYNRPGVKGREGKIYGTTVAHYGFVDLGHGTTHAAPWRAGANDNTTIAFSHAVKIEGKELPAGKYGFFIALGETESTLIFSKINNSWGSFYYDDKADALRIAVKNEALDNSVEWLKYEFVNQTDNSATIAMMWEKRAISFKVEAETKILQMEEFRNSYRTTRAYYEILSGVNWCVANNYELEQALEWADRAVSMRIMGEKNFHTLSSKAAVLSKMNRKEEADKIMSEALPFASVLDMHFYARGLLTEKRIPEAMKVFKMNNEKNPDQWYTYSGLARGYSAMGDYKKALQFAKITLAKAPDEGTKRQLEAMIAKLENGVDIN